MKIQNILIETVTDYPLAGNTIDNLTISDHVDNISSISASFDDYYILKGIRLIPISVFDNYKTFFYSKNDWDRVRKLVKDIETSKIITPLIVVEDKEDSPYILEGAHRFAALAKMGITHIPALVVIDLDD